LSRDTIDRLERRGAFPKRILLSGRKVCWDLAEIEAWHQERKNARNRRRHVAENEGALP
jgi:prophage regulatory protein